MNPPIYLYLEQLPDLHRNPAELTVSCSTTLTGPWQQTSLEQLAFQYHADQYELLLLLPGHLVISTTLEVPAGQQKHLTRILPYLCEEELACDPAAVHISAGRPRDNKVPVRIIDRQLLTDLITLFRNHQIPLAGVYSECEPLTISLHSGTTSNPARLWLGEQRCHWWQDGTSLTTTRINAETLLRALLERDAGHQQDAPALQFIHTESPDLSLSTTLHLLQAAGWQLQQTPLATSAAPCPPVLAVTPEDATAITPESPLLVYGINLLSGVFTPPRRHRRNRLPQRAAAITVSVLLMLTLAYPLASGWYLQHRARQLAQQSEALYRQYFPDDRRIIDIRRQTEVHLRQSDAATNGGFFSLLGRVHQNWNTSTDAIHLQALTYQHQRHELLLDVEASSIAQLDGLQRRLGPTATLLSASEASQSGVRGRLRIQGE